MKKLLFAFLLFAGVVLCAAHPVVPRQRYRIEFEAAPTGKVYPVEWMEQGADILKITQFKFPRVVLFFYNGKKLVRMMTRSDIWVLLKPGFTKGWFDVYAPDGATSVALVGRSAKIRNIKVSKVPAGKVVSVPMHFQRIGAFTRNTTFAVLDHNKGTAVYDTTNSGMYGDLIPVKPGERYLLTVKGLNGWRSDNVIRYHFYSSSRPGTRTCGGNKEALRVSTRRPVFKYEIMVPKNARWMHFFCMRGQVSEYTFEKL